MNFTIEKIYNKENQMKRTQFLSFFPALAILGFAYKKTSNGLSQNNLTQKTNKNMTTLTTYLLLDGNCKPAMEFYKSVFGGELTLTKVGESAAKDFMPPTMHDKVINSRLLSENVDISASDWLRPAQTPIQGNMVCLYLSGGTFDDLKILFDKLSVGANITDPLKQEFFGTYGALNDKFGIRWMFQTDKK
jgi:PhnB protein